jgi:hypothetical protein
MAAESLSINPTAGDSPAWWFNTACFLLAKRAACRASMSDFGLDLGGYCDSDSVTMCQAMDQTFWLDLLILLHN